MTEPKTVTEKIGNLNLTVQDTRHKQNFKKEIEIIRFKDKPKKEAIMLLLYGESKSGKTFFAGSAGPRVLYINTGDGMETFRNPAFTKRYGSIAEDMLLIDVREDMQEDVPGAFERIHDGIHAALAEYHDQFDTVVLDEATALRRFAMNRAIVYGNGKSRNRPLRTRSFVKAELGDYGIEMEMIEWFVAKFIPIFKEENKNFIMLAHERQLFNKPANQGEEPTLKKIYPGFTGSKFPDQIPSYFDDVWHTQKKSDVYRVETNGNAGLLAGGRHGGIFRSIEMDSEKDPFNFPVVLKRIQNAR